MIWSVSMLAPNFQARPRITFGNVMPFSLPLKGGGSGRGVRGCSCYLRRHFLQHITRVGDDAGHGAGGGHSRVGQIDRGFGMTHAARKVAVGGAEANIAFAEDSHVSAKARATGVSRPCRPGRKEYADQPLLLRLDRAFVRGG